MLRSLLRLVKLMIGECDVIVFFVQIEFEVIWVKEDLMLVEKLGLNIGFWVFNI